MEWQIFTILQFKMLHILALNDYRIKTTQLNLIILVSLLSEEAVLSNGAKTCDAFGLQSNTNLQFHFFFGTPYIHIGHIQSSKIFLAWKVRSNFSPRSPLMGRSGIWVTPRSRTAACFSWGRGLFRQRPTSWARLWLLPLDTALSVSKAS